MATPQQQPPPSQPSVPNKSPPSIISRKTDTPDWMHYGAMVCVVAGPFALFMPPRRMGFQSILLATGTSYAVNILAYDFTGESMYQRFVRRTSSAASAVTGDLPEKALRTQELMRRERERREAALPEPERRRLQEERERKERESRGVLSRLWMGSEKENWREERARKEKEALEQGKGYGDLIVEQVKEVVGSKKGGEERKQSNEDDKKQ